MVAVQSLVPGILSMEWVELLVRRMREEAIAALRIDAAAEAARTDREADIVAIADPIGALALYEETGELHIPASYELQNDGRTYTETDARIEDLLDVVSESTAYAVLSLGGWLYCGGIQVTVTYREPGADLRVEAPTPAKANQLLDELVASFPPLPENYYGEAPLVAESLPTVFIGHGGDSQWEQVRDWVSEAGYGVQVFEAEERAGFSTLVEVVEMVRRSRMGLLMLTAADTLADGTKRARENVIHELGLCQGILGVENTVVILETGTIWPSNIDGHIQIRYNRGELHRAKDRILAALARRVHP